jgi:hypothetical protein
MNNKSYKMLFESNQKLINKIINKYSESNNKISFVGIAKCLYDLKIFRELFTIRNNENKKANLNLKKNNNSKIIDLNNSDEIILKRLKYIVNNIQKGERKEEEMEFLEQIWFLLNPNNKENIYNEIFEGFIKLLFSYSDKLSTKKDIVSYLKDYLVIVNFMEPKNNNLDNKYIFSSPLRNKKFTKNDIWPLEKIVTIFLKLKQNLIAYQKQYFIQKDNSKEKELNNKNKNKNNKKHDFNKLYERFMQKKEIKEKTLERIREIEKKKDLSNCTKKPQVNKNYNRVMGILDNSYENNHIPIHERLYQRRNDKDNTTKKLKEK